MTNERFLEIVLAYAKYMFKMEGIPSFNDPEFHRQLAYTLTQEPFVKIRVTKEEALEAITKLVTEIFKDS